MADVFGLVFGDTYGEVFGPSVDPPDPSFSGGFIDRFRNYLMGTFTTVATYQGSNTASEADAIPFGQAYGFLQIPSGSPITSVALHASHDGTTFGALKFEGTALTLTVSAGEVHALPTQVYGCPYLKLITNAKGNISMSIVRS